MPEHNTLTGSSLHEPKGAATAGADEVMTSDGVGGITWQKVVANNIDGTSVKAVNRVFLHVKIPDVSTAGSHWVVCPLAGKLVNAWVVQDGALTGTATITFEIAGVAVTGNITMTTGVAGDVNSNSFTTNNSLSAGQALEVITDGGSTGTVAGTFTLEIDIS